MSFVNSVTSPGVDPKTGYQPEIDGLRALAVVAVIVNHINGNILPGGYLGVDIFFVISGFVITSSLANRPSRSLRDFLLEFYVRRIKRLVPALVLCVVVTSVLICLFNPDPGDSLRTGIASLFGLSNIYLYRQATDYFSPSAELNVFTQTWSLGVEEQFYFLFPMAVWFTGFSRSTAGATTRLMRLIAVLAVASLLIFVFLSRRNPTAVYFMMPARLWELGTGCLLFAGLNHFGRRLAFLRRIPAAAVIVAIVFVLFTSSKITSTVAVVLLTGLLIATLRQATAAYKLLTHPRVVDVGLISYSLYLWHWSVLSLSRWTIGIHWWSAPIQVALMLLLAVASSRYIERPLRRSQWSTVRWRTIGYGLAASASAAVFLVALAEPLEGRFYTGKPYPHELETKASMAASEVPACNIFQDGPDALEIANKCGGGVRDGRMIYMLGDSHIEQFNIAISAFARTQGYSWRTVWGNSCLFPGAFVIPRTIAMGGYGSGLECTQFQQRVEDRLIGVVQPGDIVFVGNALLLRFGGNHTNYENLQGKKIDLPDAVRLFSRSMESFSNKVVAKGGKVVLFVDAPEFPDLQSGQECLAEWFRPPGLLGKSCFTTMDDYKLFRRSMFGWVDQWADGKNRFVWDGFDEAECRGEICNAGNFKDSNHFKGYYSSYLFQRFLSSYQSALLKQIPPALGKTASPERSKH